MTVSSPKLHQETVHMDTNNVELAVNIELRSFSLSIEGSCPQAALGWKYWRCRNAQSCPLSNLAWDGRRATGVGEKQVSSLE